MDHPTYLEQHHEIVTKVLPTIRQRLAKGEYDGMAELFARLDAKLSDLWTQRQEAAQREVAP
jgi:hypothetical protein